MVQTYVGDYREHRIDDVGAVETAAEASLYHRDFDTLGSEPLEGHHGRDLEERQVEMVERIVPASAEIPDEILRYIFETVTLHDPRPFPEIQDMRGGEKAGADAACREHRCQHAGHRSLSVRSGHMDHLELPVRMPRQLVEDQHVFYARLVCRSARLLK